jgi:hypothetical protein
MTFAQLAKKKSNKEITMTKPTQEIDSNILNDLLIASNFKEEDDILIEIDDKDFIEEESFEDLNDEDMEIIHTKDVYFEMIRQKRLVDINLGIIPEINIIEKENKNG